MGIDTRAIVTASFGLAAALGALAGVAVAPLTQASFDAGASMGVKGFSAAILGGLGNPVAAVVGGLILGVVESMSIAFISSTYKDAIALVVLLAVLFIRPQGLLGRAPGEGLTHVDLDPTIAPQGGTRGGRRAGGGAAAAGRRRPLPDRKVLTFVGINVIVVTGIALLFGYAGQISLGHAAFVGIGAYTSA